MSGPRKIKSFVAALVVLLGTSVEAGSIHLHRTKAEIEDARDLKFYEHVVSLRNLDPKKFDRVHPLTGRMLTDERVYERLLHEWRTHPIQFELSHRCLWHTLHGEWLWRSEHPFIPAFIPPVETRTHVVSGPPPDSPPDGHPGSHDQGGGGGGGGGVHDGSVPEPSSWVLALSAVSLASLAAARRRAYVWLSTRRAG
jgi:hypothetical protein